MSKYYFDKNQLCSTPQGGQVVLCGETAHHMQNVLRMQAGDKAILCDGQGTDYVAMLLEFSKVGKTSSQKNGLAVFSPASRRKTAEWFPGIKKNLPEEDCRRPIPRNKDSSAIFRVVESCPCKSEPQTKITLYQAVPKGDKLELVIQKCVELGVVEIVPVITSRTIARAKDCAKKHTRYQRVAESAAGQSMRGIIPTVCEAVSFEAALNMTTATEVLTLVAYEEERTTTLKTALGNNSADSVNIWIGPEGGFASEEIEALKHSGAIPVSLGTRILRTETAAIAAVAQIICLLE
jgi:16S rRNA (uracil1498-N3)-methyltransferase